MPFFTASNLPDKKFLWERLGEEICVQLEVRIISFRSFRSILGPCQIDYTLQVGLNWQIRSGKGPLAFQNFSHNITSCSELILGSHFFAVTIHNEEVFDSGLTLVGMCIVWIVWGKFEVFLIKFSEEVSGFLGLLDGRFTWLVGTACGT